MAFICINNGYSNTKVKFNGKRMIFKSAIRKSNMETDQNIVVLNGVNYVVGEGTDDIRLDKTDSLVQACCIKHALSMAEYPVDVVAAMPVNAYLNRDAREQYKQMFYDAGVKRCTVFMEGMASVINDFNYYKSQGLVCLLDFGGLTINAMLVENGKLVPNTAFSMNLGAIILEERIKKALEQTELINVPSYQVKYYANKQAAFETVLSHFEEIKNQLMKAQYPSEVITRFTGGGSLDYKQTIMQIFKDVYISNNALWENVEGLEVVGGMVYA